MKSYCILPLVLLIGIGEAALAQPTPKVQAESPAANTVERQTSAQLRITAAKQQIKAHPKDTQPYVELALASLRRARETADPAYSNDAEQAISAGLFAAPNDFQLAKAQVALLLAQHEFAKAKGEAARLNRRTPDDVTTYGYLAQADIATGAYADAEKAAQWMLDLLPNNVPGLLTAAELRGLYGDPEGALELLNQAYRETPSNEEEELAWIANQIAEVDIHSGRLDAAVQVLDQAEKIFPSYPPTLQNLSQVRLEQHRYAEAVTLLRGEQAIASPALNAHRLFQLAKAEELAHQDSEAASAYAQFAAGAQPLVNAPENANRDLVFYYADHTGNWPQALQVAQHEIGVRQDVWTLDAYAWALFGSGRYAEADTQIKKALAVGVRSSQVFDHAGNIALKLQKRAEAEQCFQSALQADPASLYAVEARKSLGILGAAPSDTLPPADVSGSALSTTEPDRDQSPAAAPPRLTPPPGQVQSPPKDGFRPVPAALLAARPTETARIVRAMQSRVKSNPTDAKGYAKLGAAFFQLARETGDVENYQLAEQALNKSVELNSSDLTAAAPFATLAEVCMGEHRFQDALQYAQKALSFGSGDLSAYAIVGDAYADMGEYDKAAAAYSRMVPADAAHLQPHSTYAQDSRISYLKFIAGDTAGAIGLMQSAVAAGVEARLPRENLAWLYFELGEYYFLSGTEEAADASYLTALTIHPGDYRALAGLAKVRANQGRPLEAIALYKRAIAVVPMPMYVAELGDLYTKAGNTAEAKKQYQLVEYIGLLGHINQVLHNRDLALFYADHNEKLMESVALAHKEFEVRHDVYTWDALAWAFYKAGKDDDAQQAMDQALRFGTRDSLLLFHAGMISARLGENAQAEKQLDTAIKINPQFNVIHADEARKQLTLLRTQSKLSASGAKADAQ